MLLLAKILAVAVVVWFYLAAREHKQPPLNWAVIGFIGYGLGWGITYGLMHVLSMKMNVMVMQIPAFAGAFAAYLVREKLIADAVNNPASLQSDTE